ncbi:MAG: hypothetical protein GY851_14075, partial [bacterium]|nr:hypothetical protein [bacterium]
LAIPVAVTGCDGDGFEWPAPIGDSSGVPDSQEPGDGDDGGDTDSPDVVIPGSSTDQRFKGSWIASFSDEYSSDGNEYVYAVRLSFRRGLLSNLIGEARIARFRLTEDEAENPWEEFTAQIINASSNGDYAQLDLKADNFSHRPSFYFRSAGDRMVGLFLAFRGDTLARAGSVMWHKASEGSIEGDWVAAVRDARSSRDADVEDSGPLRDRRAGMTLNATA